MTTLHRPPRTWPAPVPTDPMRVAPPPTRNGSVGEGWLQLLFPLVGSIGLIGFGVAYGRTLFLYIAIAMAVAMLGFTALLQLQRRRSGRRTARRARKRYREHLARREAEVAQAGVLQRGAAERVHPEPDARWAIVARHEALWERRPPDADLLELRVGVGPVPHAAPPQLDLDQDPLAERDEDLVEEARAVVERTRTVADVPVCLDLDRHHVASLVGEERTVAACARSVLLELACAVAPADALVAVSCPPGEAGRWDWVKWLPHGRSSEDEVPRPRVVDEPFALSELLDELVAGRIESRRVATAAASLAAEEARAEAPHLVLLLDGFRPGDDRARLPLLREVLARGRELRVSVLCLVDRRADEPAEARVRVGVTDDGSAVLEEAGPGGRRIAGVTLDAVALEDAEALARALAPIRLEDEARRDGARADLGLLPLLGVRRVDDLRPEVEWAARPRSLALRATLGIDDAGEPLVLDLKQPAEGGMGPHGLVIGATGSGKSELLRTLVTSLAIAHSPDELAFVFADFKGGAAFAELERLPHCAGMITNLRDDLRLVDRMHEALYGEQERRQRMLRDAGNLDDVLQYRRARAAGADLPPLPDLLVAIDEFGELLTSRPEFLELFLAIGRVGRSIGMHLLLSSQRLEEGRLRGLESHLRYRIGLRTYTPMESKAVLDTDDAFRLPSSPGAGYLKVDTGTYVRFQTALASRVRDAEAPEAAGPAEVRAFGTGAGAAAGAPAPRVDAADDGDGVLRAIAERLAAGHDGSDVHQIWSQPPPDLEPLDALPLARTGDPGSLLATIGRVDLPREQRTELLTLDLDGAGGHMAVVGAPQTGKSTALRTLLLALARAHGPRDVQALVVDLGGGLLRPLEALPHVRAVAGKADPELLGRVVRQARQEVADRQARFAREGIDSMAMARGRRAAGEDAPCDLLLVVDGWVTLRREFEDVAGEVEALLAEGLPFGVHVVIGANRWTDMRAAITDAIGTRVELRLNEPLETEIDRRAQEALPSGHPGRGLRVDGREVQIALPRLDGVASASGLGEAVGAAVTQLAHAWADQPPAPRLRALPLAFGPDELPPAATGVAVGLDEAGTAFAIDVTGVEAHFLVLGDGESGRTTLLRAFLHGLERQDAVPGTEVVLVDPRRTLADAAGGGLVATYAATPADIEPAMEEVARLARGRLAGSPDPAGWTGPRTYVVVDDQDLLTSPTGGPLSPLAPVLAQGRDVGVHLVMARRVAGTSRTSFEPLMQQLLQLRPPGLILSGDRGEGPLLDGQRATTRPPGRGLLVRRGLEPTVVQVVLQPATAGSALPPA